MIEAGERDRLPAEARVNATAGADLPHADERQTHTLWKASTSSATKVGGSATNSSYSSRPPRRTARPVHRAGGAAAIAGAATGTRSSSSSTATPDAGGQVRSVATESVAQVEHARAPWRASQRPR